MRDVWHAFVADMRRKGRKCLMRRRVRQLCGCSSSSLWRAATFFIVLLLPLRDDFLDRADKPVPRRPWVLCSAVDGGRGYLVADFRRDMTRPPSLSEDESYSSSLLTALLGSAVYPSSTSSSF